MRHSNRNVVSLSKFANKFYFVLSDYLTCNYGVDYFLFYNITPVIPKIFHLRIEIVTNVTFRLILSSFLLINSFFFHQLHRLWNKRHFCTKFLQTSIHDIFSLSITSFLLDSFFPPTPFHKETFPKLGILEAEFQSETILDFSLATSTFARSFFHGFVLVSFPGSR